MRAFLAIEVSDSVREAVGGLVGRLRRCGAKVSWVRAENIHLTLRFLGDISQVDVNRICERLALAYAAEKPLTMCVRGVGAFPNLSRPRVLWVGLEVVSGDMARIQCAAEVAAQQVGLTPEKMAFKPHLTVGRIRGGHSLGSLAAKVREEGAFCGGEFTAGGVSLFSSTLRPDGAVYRRQRELPFSWYTSSEQPTAS